MKSLAVRAPSKKLIKYFSFALIPLVATTISNVAFANQQDVQLHTIDGTISIEVEDYPQHSQFRYWLKDRQGKRTEILLEKQPAWLHSGQNIRVYGNAQGKKFNVDNDAISLLQSTDTSATTSTTSAVQTITGSRSVLVAEVNFAINPISFYSTADVNELVLNQANQFFAETSYNLLSLTGDVTETITIDIDTSTCDITSLSELADEEFRDRGYEPNDYDHVMYVIPTHPKCTWSGLANVGGPRSWIKHFQAGTVNHELGHNLGLFHSNKKDCGSVTTDSNSCTVSEYGDYLSAMSTTSTAKHLNGFHKEQLGWLDNRIATLTASGEVTLSALETMDNFAPKVLKINQGVDVNGNNQWYYIEYRQAQGFDSSLATDAPDYLNGIRLREGTDNQPNSSYLLDPTPNSTSYDWDDINLDPGQSYSHNGITISVISSDASQVVVDVQFGDITVPPTECTVNASSFTATSSANVNAQAGDNVTFAYRLTNNDSSDCAATPYNFTSTLSDDLTGAFDVQQISLNPGQSQIVNLQVTVATTAVSGNYSVSSSALRLDNNQSKTQAATISIASTGSDNTAPTAVNDPVVISSKSSVVIDVLANDSDTDSDSIFITGTTQGAKGKVTLNNDNTLTYTPAKSFKSTDSFSYTISDGALSSTATVSISLQTSDDSDGGSGGGSGGNKGKKK